MGTVEDLRDIIRIWTGNSTLAAGLGLVKGVDPNTVILPSTHNVEIVGITVSSQENVRDVVLLRRHGICLVHSEGTIVIGEELICSTINVESPPVISGRFVTPAAAKAASTDYVDTGDMLNICGKALSASVPSNWIWMQVYKRFTVLE